jgi:hypothetical protein
MRKLQISLFTFLTAMVFFACKKETDQILAFDQLGIGSYLMIDKANSTEFNFAQINTSAVSWDTHVVGEAGERVISYVSSSSNSANKTTWKKIKETPVGADGNVTISVTGAQLATALGIAPTALAPGTQYVIYNELVTKSGKIYNYNNTNAEVESAAAYKMGLRMFSTITCPFDPTNFAGDFTVVYDNDWQDFDVGEILRVTEATANTIKLLQYPSPAYGFDRKEVTVNINPANGRATIALQAAGTYAPNIPAQVRTSASRTSYVFSCTGDIILYQDVIYGSATYSTMLLRLKKR